MLKRRFSKPFVPFLLLVSVVFAFGQTIDVDSRPLRTEPSREFQALHYRVVLELNPVAKSYSGETTIVLSPFRDGMDSCILNAQTFTVDAVRSAEGRPLCFAQSAEDLRVEFLKAFAAGETVEFVVSYHADHLADSQGGKKGINFVEESADHPSLIVAESFPDGARHWFPCYDHPNGKATFEVIATVPHEYRVLSNGRLVGTAEDAVKRTATFHWSQERPQSTYLSALIAGPYRVTEDSLGPLPIDYWYYEKDKARAPLAFRRTPEIIKFLNGIYGYDYPWAKYDQIIVPGNGGMETTTATMLYEGLVQDEKAARDFPVADWLITHEAAHQWWGDLVTCRDWAHAWINEGFATYSEVEFAAYDAGPEEAALDLQGKKNRYIQEAHTRYMRPIVFPRWDKPQDNFDRHTYQKAAAVIDMLRWVLGEGPYRRAISHFLHKHAFQPADTNDLLTAIKEATGQNLDWFFGEWLLSPGHPVFDVRTYWNGAKKTLTWRVLQIQDTSAGIPYFRTPVILGVVTSAGKTEEKVWLSGRESDFTFDCPSRPLMVRFDVGNHLLKELNFERPVGDLLYQLDHDGVLGRMWAASELGRHADDPRVGPALARCAVRDPFWAVRRDALYILGGFEGPIEMNERGNISFRRLNEGYRPGKFLSPEIVDFLRERAGDPNPKVRAAALWALGNFRERALVPFLKERFGADDSYIAQAAVLIALGKTGDRSLSPFLEAASSMKTHAIVKQAAEWALTQVGPADQRGRVS